MSAPVIQPMITYLGSLFVSSIHLQRTREFYAQFKIVHLLFTLKCALLDSAFSELCEVLQRARYVHM